MTTQESATRHLTAADAAIRGRDWQAANRALDDGLAALGDGYRSDATLDDTGQKLALAGAQAAKGDAESAAAIKHRVLEARLEMCRGR